MPEAVKQHRALALTPDEVHPSHQPCTPNLHLATSETGADGAGARAPFYQLIWWAIA
jgi:hypothetical protein